MGRIETFLHCCPVKLPKKRECRAWQVGFLADRPTKILKVLDGCTLAKNNLKLDENLSLFLVEKITIDKKCIF